MTPIRYAVLRFERGWQVLTNGQRLGPYATEASAVHAASTWAGEAAGRGESTEVIVQDDFGRLNRMPVRPAVQVIAAE